jgi:cell division septum initiation protein DivIVA
MDGKSEAKQDVKECEQIAAEFLSVIKERLNEEEQNECLHIIIKHLIQIRNGKISQMREEINELQSKIEYLDKSGDSLLNIFIR